MRVFLTGSAGFIGFHVACRLLADGHAVAGYDGMTNYYDPGLKQARLNRLSEHIGFSQVQGMLEDADALTAAYVASRADVVIHLGAQAGVRYSIENPASYIQSNIVGTANLLEALRQRPPEHLIFASTSSIYGGNEKMPFAETDRADGPVSLYAATKKSGEAMVHSYAHLWGIASTCVRFFTAYGPWGRPDMAPLKFATRIRDGKPIDVYGQGKMRRDFTYVDDLVDAVVRLIATPPVLGQRVRGAADSLSAVAPFRIVNIGGGRPTELMAFIRTLETAMKKSAQLNFMPMQAGDVVETEADTQLLDALIGKRELTPIEVGVSRFIDWFDHYYSAAH